MTGACKEHKSRKKGACIYCNVCRLCEPLESCSNKSNYINWKRNAMRDGTYVAQITPAAKRSKNIGRQRKSSMRGKRKSTPLLVDTDEEIEAVERNPRERLTQVCEALDIDTDLLHFPSNGFTIEPLEKSTGIKRV